MSDHLFIPPTFIQILPDETIISADGDIVDLPSNVFLLPVTELADGVQLISHPNKEAACLYRCHMCQLIEILHEGLDAKSFFVCKERPVLLSSATTAWTGIVLNGFDASLQ